jgi:Raf kinase inhibitor-like YbhB/YbcL family protein
MPLPRIVVAVVAAVAVAACSATPTTGSPSPATAVATTAPPAPPSSGTPPASAAASPSTTPVQTASTKEPAVTLSITSDAFAEGGAIPSRYTCDGADISPALRWAGLPPGTVALALVADDPDAGGFVHWVAYDLDPAPGGLDAAVPAPDRGGPPQGRNGFGRIGYGGPCPPSGTHHYRFRLLALSARLSISGTATAASVLAAATGHILGEAVLTATYRRH